MKIFKPFVKKNTNFTHDIHKNDSFNWCWEGSSIVTNLEYINIDDINNINDNFFEGIANEKTKYHIVIEENIGIGLDFFENQTVLKVYILTSEQLSYLINNKYVNRNEVIKDMGKYDCNKRLKQFNSLINNNTRIKNDNLHYTRPMLIKDLLKKYYEILLKEEKGKEITYL